MLLFNKILKECPKNEEYASVSKTKELSQSTESLFMGFNIQTIKNDKRINKK
jgi:hypothetical protein